MSEGGSKLREEECRRSTFVAGAIARDTPQRVGLRDDSDQSCHSREEELRKRRAEERHVRRRQQSGWSKWTLLSGSREAVLPHGEFLPFRHAHAAVMRSIAPAARRQPRFLTACTQSEKRGEQRQSKDRYQRDGEELAQPLHSSTAADSSQRTRGIAANACVDRR